MIDRQRKILEILTNQHAASVLQLSEVLKVSAVTIRSDLDQLEQKGQIIRTHGGALLAEERTRQEFTYATRKAIHADRKHRIGKAAAALVQPFDSILLDASTTAVAVGQALKRIPGLNDITIIATGIWTALEMLGVSGFQVVLLGGSVRDATGSTSGSIAIETINRFNFNKAFLGAWGLTLEEGLMDSPLAEVELKRAAVGRSQEVIAILDGSKFGRLGLGSFATLKQITRIVTDSNAPRNMLQALRQRGIEVIVAEEKT